MKSDDAIISTTCERTVVSQYVLTAIQKCLSTGSDGPELMLFTISATVLGSQWGILCLKKLRTEDPVKCYYNNFAVLGKLQLVGSSIQSLNQIQRAIRP